VQYFHLFAYYHNYAEEFSNLSRIFKGMLKLILKNKLLNTFLGHILLTFCPSYDVNKYPPSNIINQLGTQLYRINCNGTYLTDSTKVPRLNLYCCVIEIDNLRKLSSIFNSKSFKDQFKRVLINHQIRELTVLNLKLSNARFDGEYFKIVLSVKFKF
jgi:hypothetical protein